MDPSKDEHDIICTSSGSAFFDEVVGHIEDIVLGDEFQDMQNEFLENNWHSFEFGEENKLECMDVFEEYVNKFEKYVMQQLHQRMTNFDMEKFFDELKAYDTSKDPYRFGESEIFEFLQSFSNFETFKELMLDYRNKKEGNFRSLDFDILITTPFR